MDGLFVKSSTGYRKITGARFNPQRALFKGLNSDKYGNHAANFPLRDELGVLRKVRCNCGKHTYHPVVKGKVQWEDTIEPSAVPVVEKMKEEFAEK